MSDLRELKPCPFCGGSGFIEHYNQRPEECWADQYRVVCKKCGVATKFFDGHVGNGISMYDYDSEVAKNQAIEAWNKRNRVKVYDNEIHVPLLKKHFSEGIHANAMGFCKIVGITRDTFTSWRRIHPEFKKAWDEILRELRGGIRKEGFSE